MNKIEHIGIAVKNLEDSNKLFTALLNTEPYKVEKVASEAVSTSFFKVGESKIELLEATGPNSAIAKFIEKRGEGIHHIAYDVADIEAEMKRLANEGFTLLNETPKKGPIINLFVFCTPNLPMGCLLSYVRRSAPRSFSFFYANMIILNRVIVIQFLFP